MKNLRELIKEALNITLGIICLAVATGIPAYMVYMILSNHGVIA